MRWRKAADLGGHGLYPKRMRMAAPFNAVPFHDPKITGQAIMTRKSSDQFLANDNYKKGERAVSSQYAFSPDLPAAYAKKMVERESRGNGDQLNAMDRVARRCGMTARSLRRLINGETKDPGLALFGRVRRAYLEYCAHQIAELQNEIAMETTRCGDDTFEDLAAQADALAAKIKAAKEGKR